MGFDGVKIAFGYEIKDGPWGGGNQVLRVLKRHLENKGARITQRLEDGLDLIIIINPRKESATFDLSQIQKYKKKHPQVKIICRINDTDKSGKVYKIDGLRLNACRNSDGIIFISDWVRNYYLEKGVSPKIPHAVIHNGPEEEIFHSRGYVAWQEEKPMKIITHHWSDNPMKGLDIYQHFDELLDDPWMRKHFEFTYIGRLPNNTRLKNTRYISPLSAQALAEKLRQHHVYLTAARWEACGMHQLEGACCGLPVLFINEGGGMVETCQGFGIQFTKSTFAVSLFKMLEEYPQFQPKMKNFPLTSIKMNSEYEEFIARILNRKE